MIKQKILIAITALLFVVTACTKENVVGIPGEQPVKIMFRTGTRSIGTPAPGSVEDRYINSLRILGYRTSDGTLAFNVPVYGLPDATPSTPETAKESHTGEIKVKTGKFCIVFIANEHSDAAAGNLLKNIDEATNNTLDYLKSSVSFAQAAFDAGKDIPMVTVKENITIQGDNKLIDPEIQAAPFEDKWPVSMQRLGVRVDLTLTLSEANYDGWYNADNGNVFFNNVPKFTYLFPGSDNSDDRFTANEVCFDKNRWPSVLPTTAEGNKTITFDRIILPESYFTPVATAGKGLQLRITINGVERKGVITTGNAGTGYTIPRNTYLKVSARLVNEADFDFEIQAVDDWKNEDIGHDL